MLLDEVAAHLDDVKREALLEKIVDLNVQAWITTTNPELFDSLRTQAQFFEVRNNNVICDQNLFCDSVCDSENESKKSLK